MPDLVTPWIDAWQDPVTRVVVAALMGMLIGSFVNLVIDRLPVMLERQWAADAASMTGSPPPASDRYDLIAPRSHCPHCHTKLSMLELIPIASWISLRGRCRHCGTPIGRRTLWVEAGLALLYAMAAWRFGAQPMTLAAMVLLGTLVAASVIDLETRLLPDVLTLPLLWIGLLLNLGELFTDLDSAVLGAALGYGTLWTVNRAYLLVSGRDGMGQGDFKLLAALGAWLGWQSIPVILVIASASGALFGVVLLLRDASRRGAPIAFGPWLALAALPVIFGLVSFELP